MLSSSNRLSSAAEFRQAVRRGRRAGGPLVVLHLVTPDVDKATSTPDGEPGRVGFVVARSVGSAVTRNLVKRRLRHLMRARVGILPAGCLLVVRAMPGAAAASYQDLGDELDRCLRRAVAS